MVMIRPPAYHFWKFLMKNMIPTNSGLTGNLKSNTTPKINKQHLKSKYNHKN